MKKEFFRILKVLQIPRFFSVYNDKKAKIKNKEIKVFFMRIKNVLVMSF